jgi:hypothetical protein
MEIEIVRKDTYEMHNNEFESLFAEYREGLDRFHRRNTEIAEKTALNERLTDVRAEIEDQNRAIEGQRTAIGNGNKARLKAILETNREHEGEEGFVPEVFTEDPLPELLDVPEFVEIPEPLEEPEPPIISPTIPALRVQVSVSNGEPEYLDDDRTEPNPEFVFFGVHEVGGLPIDADRDTVAQHVKAFLDDHQIVEKLGQSSAAVGDRITI